MTNVEALIQECVPGGDICDPQQVADSIRAYFERTPPSPGGADAPIQGADLTDAEILSIADKAKVWYPMGSGIQALTDRARLVKFARTAISQDRERRGAEMDLRAAIDQHNAACVASCENEWNRKLRACDAFTSRGRRCPECPRDDLIDVPAAATATVVGAERESSVHQGADGTNYTTGDVHRLHEYGIQPVHQVGVLAHDAAAQGAAGAARPATAPAGEFFDIALNTTHPKCHEAAKAFWDYWEANGETHKHGHYESTWGAINRALRLVGTKPHEWKKP